MQVRGQAGFTIVELVVTLFVAALLIIAGYNLYGVVIRNAAESRRMSEASVIAYDVLRTKAADVAHLACPADKLEEQTLQPQDLQKVAKLPKGKLKLYCGIPHEYMKQTGGIAVLKAQVAYGDGQEKVEHAVYIAK